MHSTLSLLASALFLSLYQTANARIANPQHRVRDASSNQEPVIEARNDAGLFSPIKNFFRRQQPNAYCTVDDPYVQALNSIDVAPAFCFSFLRLSPTTTTVFTAPTVYTTKVTTSTRIHAVNARTTVTLTDTITVSTTVALAKRAPAPTTPPKLGDLHYAIRQVMNGSQTNNQDAEFVASVSSACSCISSISSSVVTTTVTDEPVTATRMAIQYRDIDSTSVQARTAVVTTTVVAAVTAAPSRTSSSVRSVLNGTQSVSVTEAASNGTSLVPSVTPTLPSVPSIPYANTSLASLNMSSTSTAGPISVSAVISASASLNINATSTASSLATTSPGFNYVLPDLTCPDGNNTQVATIIGDERYDYLILCGYDGRMVNNTALTGLRESSAVNCIAACGYVNNGFSDDVCIGVTYVEGVTEGNSCFLLENITTLATGVQGTVTFFLVRGAYRVTDESKLKARAPQQLELDANATSTSASAAAATTANSTASATAFTSSMLSSMFSASTITSAAMTFASPADASGATFSTTSSGGFNGTTTMSYTGFSTTFSAQTTTVTSSFTTVTTQTIITTVTYINSTNTTEVTVSGGSEGGSYGGGSGDGYGGGYEGGYGGGWNSSSNGTFSSSSSSFSLGPTPSGDRNGTGSPSLTAAPTTTPGPYMSPTGSPSTSPAPYSNHSSPGTSGTPPASNVSSTRPPAYGSIFPTTTVPPSNSSIPTTSTGTISTTGGDRGGTYGDSTLAPYPTGSSNSTASVGPTGVSSSEIPTPSNSSSVILTPTAPYPVLSHNSTTTVGPTGYGSFVPPLPSLNSSIPAAPYPTGNSSTPSGPTGGYTGFPMTSSRTSLGPTDTGGRSGTISTTTTPYANFTTPTPYVNATSSAPPVNATSSAPYGNFTSIPHTNSTTDCPTATLITVTVTETETAVTTSVTTVYPSYPPYGIFSSLASATAASSSPTPTAAALAAACSERGNIVSNGNFTQSDANGGAADWDVAYADPSSGDPGLAFALVNGQAQFFFASTDSDTATITISQVVTLCPQSLYTLNAQVRQDSILMQCTATFSIGNRLVFAVEPTTQYQTSTGSYSSGVGGAASSLDLTVAVRCDGTPDAAGKFILNVDDISLALA